MSTEFNGGCQCGAIRYRISGEPHAVTACYCTDRQHPSGGAFGMSAIFSRSEFKLTKGTPRTFTKTAESGRTIDCASVPTAETGSFTCPSSAPTQ